MVLAHHAFSFPLLGYLIACYLISVPFVLHDKIKISLKPGDILLGILVSGLILVPLGGILYLGGRSLLPVSAAMLLFQLVVVAFPEELYFRGFLQERLGNTVQGVVITSTLFSFMHVPQLIIHGDMYSVLTFFPSLVMGFLYAKTSNILPSTIFHLFANILWLGFSR